MSVTEQVTTSYPTKDDKTVGQLAAYEVQLHALMTSITMQYSNPTLHQIGESMKMIAVLAHDMEFMATGLSDQYEQAEQDAQAARLLTQE